MAGWSLDLLRTQQTAAQGLRWGMAPTQPHFLSLPAECIQDPRVPEKNGATGQKEPESPRGSSSAHLELHIIRKCIYPTELLGLTCYMATQAIQLPSRSTVMVQSKDVLTLKTEDRQTLRTKQFFMRGFALWKANSIPLIFPISPVTDGQFKGWHSGTPFHPFRVGTANG